MPNDKEKEFKLHKDASTVQKKGIVHIEVVFDITGSIKLHINEFTV